MKIELTHDLIARKVYDMVSSQDRARAHAQHIVRVKYDIYKTSSNVLLSDDELAIVKPHLSAIVLSQDENTFIQKSRNSVAWAHKKNIIRNSAIVLMGVALSLTTWGMTERHRANRQMQLSNDYGMRLLELSQAVRDIENYDDLAQAKIASETLSTVVLQNQDLTGSLTPSTGSVVQPLADTQPLAQADENQAGTKKSSPTRNTLQPFYIQGVVREAKSDRGIRRAKIEIAGIATETNDEGYFSIPILSNLNFLPDSIQIMVNHPAYESLVYNISSKRKNSNDAMLTISPYLTPRQSAPNFNMPPSQKLLPKKPR